MIYFTGSYKGIFIKGPSLMLQKTYT